MSSRIIAGRTKPGKDWKPDGERANHIYIDVDTSFASFASTPVYVCSLDGTEWQMYTVGGSSVYNATATGFRVYLRWSPTKKWPMANLVARADDRKWHINWIGAESA